MNYLSVLQPYKQVNRQDERENNEHCVEVCVQCGIKADPRSHTAHTLLHNVLSFNAFIQTYSLLDVKFIHYCISMEELMYFYIMFYYYYLFLSIYSPYYLNVCLHAKFYSFFVCLREKREGERERQRDSF